MSDIDHPIYHKSTPEKADALAWVFSSPEKFEKYYFQFPELKKDEVRARIIYTSLCHSDTLTGRSQWGKCEYPMCVGHEVVGELIKVGEDVKDLKIGDKIGFGPFRTSCGKCKWCLKGWTHACDMDLNIKFLYGKHFGGYATHIQQPGQLCFKIPEGMDLSKTPPLMCAGITTYLPLALYADKTSKVAVYGIGGLGHLAVQYASKMAEEVHAFTSSKSKEDYILKLGADKVIIWDDFYAQEHVERKYDLIIDTLPFWPSEEKVQKWLASLAPYGKLVLIGIGDLNNVMNVDVRCLVFNHNAIVGSLVGGKKHTEEMLKFSKEHNIECLCEYYDFEEFPKALDKLENGKPQFRGVVRVEETAKKIEQKDK